MAKDDLMVQQTSAPLRIDRSSVKPLASQVEKKRKYWIGLTSECPFSVLSVCGITFHHKVEPIRHDEKTNDFFRVHRTGETVELTDEQVDAIKLKAVTKVIRAKKDRLTECLNSDSKYYSPDPIDKPVGSFIYIVPVSGDSVPRGYQQIPAEPLIR